MPLGNQRQNFVRILGEIAGIHFADFVPPHLRNRVDTRHRADHRARHRAIGIAVAAKVDAVFQRFLHVALAQQEQRNRRRNGVRGQVAAAEHGIQVVQRLLVVLGLAHNVARDGNAHSDVRRGN